MRRTRRRLARRTSGSCPNTRKGRRCRHSLDRRGAGCTTPTGETEFHFQAGSFNFHSTAYDWLVVSGPKAQYKGSGTINGASSYGFLLTATDGQVTGGGGVDKFRIKVWDTATDSVIYDNVRSAPDTLDSASPQAIGGGSIVLHK